MPFANLSGITHILHARPEVNAHIFKVFISLQNGCQLVIFSYFNILHAPSQTMEEWRLVYNTLLGYICFGFNKESSLFSLDSHWLTGCHFEHRKYCYLFMFGTVSTQINLVLIYLQTL
jgi:hypothetical protein